MSGFTFVFLSADDKFQYTTIRPFFHIPDTQKEGPSTRNAPRNVKVQTKKYFCTEINKSYIVKHCTVFLFGLLLTHLFEYSDICACCPAVMIKMDDWFTHVIVYVQFLAINLFLI